MNGPFSMAMLNNQRVGQIECGILCSKPIWILIKPSMRWTLHIYVAAQWTHQAFNKLWNGWEHRCLLLDVLMFSWIPVFTKKNIQHAPIWMNKSHILLIFAAEICNFSELRRQAVSWNDPQPPTPLAWWGWIRGVKTLGESGASTICLYMFMGFSRGSIRLYINILWTFYGKWMGLICTIFHIFLGMNVYEEQVNRRVPGF